MRGTWLSLALMALVAVGCDDDGSNSPTGDGGAGAGGSKLDGGGGTGGSAGGTAGGDGGVHDAGATDGGGNATMALAALAPTSAFGAGDAGAGFAGSVVFVQSGTTAKAVINLTGAPVGQHGIHIHVGGSCADTVADGGVTAAGMAGAHWNPAGAKHGELGADGGMHHAGDLGNIVVGSNGAGNKSVTTTEWKVGDVVGKTVVLHMNVDDLTTDPSGNSGTRIACGVIVAR